MVKSFSLIIALFCSSLYGQESIVATVTEVYDGDTFYIDIENVHNVFGKRLGVRVNGIDTPEIRSKHKKLAIQAKRIAETKLLNKQVKITNIKRDKYFRIRGDVLILPDDENFGQFMLDIQCAKPYNGGTREK